MKKTVAMIGVFSKTLDSNFIEAACLGGIDFIILDMEHGPNNWDSIHNHSRAAKLSGSKSIVRVTGCDHSSIGLALDSGADGVQVPNVTSAKMAREAVNAARFSPLGSRGVCRFVKDAKFGQKDRNIYFKEANEKLLILQVEGREGITQIGDILQVEGFDVLFIGPYDLSQSLGIPGQVDHPRIFALCKDLLKRTKESGIMLGVFVDTLEQAKKYKTIGLEYIAYSVDISIFREAVNDMVVSFKSL